MFKQQPRADRQTAYDLLQPGHDAPYGQLRQYPVRSTHSSNNHSAGAAAAGDDQNYRYQTRQVCIVVYRGATVAVVHCSSCECHLICGIPDKLQVVICGYYTSAHFACA
jgi:hypothetical protein